MEQHTCRYRFFSIFTDISIIIGVISPIYLEYISDDPTIEIMRTGGRLRFPLVLSKPLMASGFDG